LDGAKEAKESGILTQINGSTVKEVSQFPKKKEREKASAMVLHRMKNGMATRTMDGHMAGHHVSKSPKIIQFSTREQPIRW